MLLPKSLPKSQLVILIIILAAAVLGTLYLLYTKVLAPKGILVPSLSPKTQIKLYQGSVKLPDTKGFDPNFFNSEGVRDFENYADLPITPLVPGNPNPFISTTPANTKATNW